MLDTAVIECINLTKSYANIPALREVNLTVHHGESFGLLGENGAGKSSLVRLLMGFTFPNRGQIKIFNDADVGRARPRIGYLPEQPQYDRRFSANEYLHYLGQLCGIPRDELRQRISDLLELVDLGEAATRRISTYSKGMTQRVGIAAALINKPALLILDEPSAGLDPGGQYDIRNVLARLRGEGVTMLLCSHQLSEVEELCDSVGILRRGELVRVGAVAELLDFANLVEIVTDGLTQATLHELRGLGLDSLEQDGNRLIVPANASPHLLRVLLDADAHIISLNPLRRTLEEVYLQVSRGVQGKLPTRPVRATKVAGAAWPAPYTANEAATTMPAPVGAGASDGEQSTSEAKRE